MKIDAMKIGETRGKVAVYCSLRTDVLDELFSVSIDSLSASDLFDAYSMFEYLVSWEVRKKVVQDAFLNQYSECAYRLRDLLKKGDSIDRLKSELSINTIFDTIKHGRLLIAKGFL